MSLRDLILDTFATGSNVESLRRRWRRLTLEPRAFERLLAIEDCASDLVLQLHELGLDGVVANRYRTLIFDRAVAETARMMPIRVELDGLLDELARRAVPMTVLKGAAFMLAGLRPRRAFVDIDILVAPNVLPEAVAVVRSLGYRPRAKGAQTFSHHLPQFDRAHSAPVEIHTRALSRVEGGGELRWETRTIRPGVSVLTPTDWCWHTLAHESHHYEVSGRVRGALDVAALIRAFGPEIDLGVLGARAAHWGDSPMAVLESVRRLGIDLPTIRARRVRISPAALALGREHAARVAKTDEAFHLALYKLGELALLPVADWRSSRLIGGRPLRQLLANMARDAIQFVRAVTGRDLKPDRGSVTDFTATR